MKKVWALVLMGFMALTVTAADKLPLYDTPEWHALPGMKEVKTAAEKGDVNGQYLLAIAILEGKQRLGLLMETIDMEWELKAMAQGVSIFASPVAGRDEKKVLSAFRNFAEKGFFVAQRTVAEMLLAQNKSEAVDWWRKAASQGDNVSQYNLGKYYLEGEFGKADPEMTLKYWELSAAQGNAGALKDLGVFWKDGLNGKRDIAKGIKYFKLAVEKGDTPAAYILGEIYSEGQFGIPVDHKQAAKYFRKAAEKEKNVATQIERTAELHFQYAQSYQKEKNLAKRDELLNSAAKLGHRIAPVTIIREKFQKGNEKEKNEAVNEMLTLAQKGNSYAQLNLSFIYFSLKRYEEGCFWYCRALGNGEIYAFTSAPGVIFKNAGNFTDEHKRFLKGVFLRADYLNDSDMQYVAMQLLYHNIVSMDNKKAVDYHEMLMKKRYPKVLYPFLVLTIQNEKNLSEADKADIVLQIDELADYLRYRAAKGDNEAVHVLETYSANPEPEKSENNSNSAEKK